MAKNLTLKAPGSVLDYGARKHKLNLDIDPSPKGFFSRSITTKGRITVTVRPGGENKGIEPIVLSAQVKSLVLKLEDVTLQDQERLKDIIFLVNDDKNVADVTFEADPQGELFEEREPGAEEEGAMPDFSN